jgi:hypothetical protein
MSDFNNENVAAIEATLNTLGSQARPTTPKTLGANKSRHKRGTPSRRKNAQIKMRPVRT